jgi:hypothetical protein
MSAPSGCSGSGSRLLKATPRFPDAYKQHRTHTPMKRSLSNPYQFSRVEVRLVLPSPQHGIWWRKATRATALPYAS